MPLGDYVSSYVTWKIEMPTTSGFLRIFSHLVHFMALGGFYKQNE